MSGWINELVEFWINRCNLYKKKMLKNTHTLTAYNTVNPHNFVLSECKYNTNIDLICEPSVYTNEAAIPRLNFYIDYFNKINNNYSFNFVFNHLDIFWKPFYIENIDPICMACSIANIDSLEVIPILDAHHLWNCKKNTIYNTQYDLGFNMKPFSEKISKIVWRGGLIPTFYGPEGLLNLRKDVCEMWCNNDKFDIGVSNNDTLYTKNYLNLYEFSTFKYILNIDGYGSSFDGTIWKLRSPSLVIWITDQCNNMYTLQWYTPLLKPYVHYVPSSIDKLQETFEWCENHPEKCIEIINESTRLIEDILQNTDKYHRALFNTLNEIYNKQ